MNSIADLRKYQYEYHYKLYPYIKNWKKSPYTWFKAKFYMEASAVLVYLLLKTKIKPNTVTITYGVLGLAGGILLALPVKWSILTAISIFFLKGVLDWSDGHLARITKQTSVKGDILDHYGGMLGGLSLQIGLGFYVAQKANTAIFYYLIPLIPFFYSARLTSFADNILFHLYLNPERIKKYKISHRDGPVKTKTPNFIKILYGKIRNLANKFLDDRARTVDFICLLVLLELFTPIFVTWFVFCLLILKQFFLFFDSFYVVARSDWAEKVLASKVKQIQEAFNPHERL